MEEGVDKRERGETQEWYGMGYGKKIDVMGERKKEMETSLLAHFTMRHK